MPELSFTTESDGIALLTIDRPTKLNALTQSLLREIGRLVERCEEDAAVRGLVVTGAGEKAFVAGADIEELAGVDALGARQAAYTGQEVFRRLELMPKPSVAAINGYALGAGLELALACSVRLAVPQAQLGLPEGKLGIIPGYGGTQRLPRLIGRGRALEMMLTSTPIDAPAAKAWGLVNEVHEPGQLLEAARTFLRRTFVNGPLSNALLLRTVDSGLQTDLDTGLSLEASAFGLARSTADCQEGLDAFLQKRKPRFIGR